MNEVNCERKYTMSWQNWLYFCEVLCLIWQSISANGLSYKIRHAPPDSSMKSINLFSMKNLRHTPRSTSESHMTWNIEQNSLTDRYPRRSPQGCATVPPETSGAAVKRKEACSVCSKCSSASQSGIVAPPTAPAHLTPMLMKTEQKNIKYINTQALAVVGKGSHKNNQRST